MFIFIISCTSSFCQSVTSISIHENKDNSTAFPFQQDVRPTVITLDIITIGLGKYYNEQEALLFNLAPTKMNTALEFVEKDRPNTVFRYPVHPESFDFAYFNETITLLKDKEGRIEFTYSVKYMDSLPIVLIETVVLLQ